MGPFTLRDIPFVGNGGTSYGPLTTDWVSRVVGNGGSVSTGTKDAVNTFETALSAASLTSLIYRLNFYGGTGLSACAVPFINTKGNTLDSLNNFVSGDYSESTGLTGNGSTKWVNTGLNLLSDIPSINSFSFAAYIRSNTQEDKLTMGAVTSGNSSSLAYLYIRDSSNIRKGVACAENGARNDGTDSRGLWHISRTSSSLITLYRNGSSLATDSGSAGTLPNLSMYVHCWNDSAFGAQLLTARPLGGYVVGAGFNSTQAADFYTAWQALQTAFARNV